MINNIEILSSEDFRRSVEANLDRNPLDIALDKKLAHRAEVASQVKYLRRAERKLPAWFAARCIIPPLAFEQSSSDQTAERKNYSGRLAIDLTCGLGVDSYYLSKRFERVVAIERDPDLAAIARENFRRLGAGNIEVLTTSAEDFLANLLSDGFIRRREDRTATDEQRAQATPLFADLVYADPDRRNAEGKKMVRIEDCSPNISALLPLVRRIAPRLVVKLSPLFDVDEVFRIFGTNTRVEVVSVADECKEIIADIEFLPSEAQSADKGSLSVRRIRAVAIGLGEVEYVIPNGVCNDDDKASQKFYPETFRYLIIPDVALQKARLARRYMSERGIFIDSDNGYGFSAQKPSDIPAKIHEIVSIEPFDPKELKRRLKTENIKNINILKHNFPLPTADLVRGLGIREGGVISIAFTHTADRLWQILLK